MRSLGDAIEKVLARLGDRPAAAARERPSHLRRALAGVRYRMVGSEDIAAMLGHAGDLLRRHGSLAAVFRAADDPAAQDSLPGLTGLARALRGRDPSPGLSHLVPDPARGGACKRLCLLLRWLVRREPPDLGLWTFVPPARLVIPLDVHVHRIARYIGLTERRSPGWRTAREITDALRSFDPDDPTSFDFALAHTGISGDCRHRYEPAVCPGCSLYAVCRLARAGAAEPGEPSLAP